MNNWKPLDVTENNYWHDLSDHLMHSLNELSYNGLITVKHIEEAGEKFLRLLKDFTRYRRYVVKTNHLHSSNGSSNLSNGALLFEFHKKKRKSKLYSPPSKFEPTEYHDFALAPCTWKADLIYATAVLAQLQSVSINIVCHFVYGKDCCIPCDSSVCTDC